MFDCGPPVPGEFLCRFTANEMFTSGALEVNRHQFEDSQYSARESHANELTNLLGGDYSAPDLSPPIQPQQTQQRQRPPAKSVAEPPSVELPSKNPGRPSFIVLPKNKCKQSADIMTKCKQTAEMEKSKQTAEIGLLHNCKQTVDFGC